MFQIRTVLSAPYVTNSPPSGPNASPWTAPMCPSKTAQEGSAAASGQTRIGFWVPALTMLAMTRPPGLSAAAATWPQPPNHNASAVRRRRSHTPIQPLGYIVAKTCESQSKTKPCISPYIWRAAGLIE
jgi:hypothetical protein